MSKKIFAASAIISFLSATSGFAADLPSLKAPPPPPPPPLMSWTGFYVGLNAGGTWGQSQSVNFAAVDLFDDPLWFPGVVTAASATGVVSNSGVSGFIGGGQIGYNYQFGSSLLVGVEADIQGLATSGGRGQAVGVVNNVLTGSSAVTVTEASKSLDYLGTVRGRLGYLVTPTLLAYGTGGLAYGGVNFTFSQYSFDSAGFYGLGAGTAAFSNTRAGWTAGGGVEWMFWPNWSAKVEYLYYDLGTVTATLAPVAGLAFTFNMPPGSYGWVYASNASARFNGHIVRAGVNYHFNWGAAPVIARF